MACIGCENFAKRVSNVYRDEEIKEKFESIIGYEILSDSFICDDCLSKLQEVISFRDQCRKIHEKYHPDAKVRLTVLGLTAVEIPAENIIVEERNELLETIEEIDQTLQEHTFTEEAFSIEENEPSPKRRSSGRKKIAKTERQESPMVVTISNENENESMYEIRDSLNDESKSKSSRKSWTVAQKLDIVAYAEGTSNRQAARHYNLNESTVRCFRRQKDALQTMKPTKSTNRHGVAYWPDLENHLKEWVNARETRPKIHEIQKHACQLAKTLGCENFSGSTSYIFKFMQRNNINSSSPRPRKTLKTEIIDDPME